MTKRFAILLAASIALVRPEVARAITNGAVLSYASADALVLIFIAESSICSGALISPTVVLTAAHCVTDPTPADYIVLGGSHPLQTALFTRGASEIHGHPSYNPNDLTHDVGVIVLDSAAPVTPLPWFASDEGYYAPAGLVGLLGFGATSPLAGDEGTRRGGVATIISVSTGDFTSDDTSGSGACVGDSGGPAITNDLTISPTVIGVSSYGDQNCAEFSVFDRTDDNADFISLFAPEPGADAGVAVAFGSLVLLARPRA